MGSLSPCHRVPGRSVRGRCAVDTARAQSIIAWHASISSTNTVAADCVKTRCVTRTRNSCAPHATSAKKQRRRAPFVPKTNSCSLPTPLVRTCRRTVDASRSAARWHRSSAAPTHRTAITRHMSSRHVACAAGITFCVPCPSLAALAAAPECCKRSPLSLPKVETPPHTWGWCSDGVTAACRSRQPDGAGSIPARSSEKTKERERLCRVHCSTEPSPAVTMRGQSE